MFHSQAFNVLDVSPVVDVDDEPCTSGRSLALTPKQGRVVIWPSVLDHNTSLVDDRMDLWYVCYPSAEPELIPICI